MYKISILFIFLYSLLYSQHYPHDFISPLEIPIHLSANYAELRKNHFHSGLDIKTQQRTGLKVLAVQEGYVARINISPYGYGKAIYIAHPNGYTTVYGHLSTLVGAIGERAREEQYKKKSFTVDFTLNPNELAIKQGELIALSGNTGGSGGPHLHFEIRNTQTEETLNPLLFGFNVPDHVKPQINSVWIYPVDGTVNESLEKVQVVNNKIYKANGTIGFGIKTYDKQSFSNNLNGIYFIKTYVNEHLISTFKADQFSFDESRFINATIDYAEQKSKNSWIYRTYTLPGNSLQMFEQKENRGLLSIVKDSTYHVRIDVGDYAGNISSRGFTIMGTDGESRIKTLNNDKNTVFFDKPFKFSKDEVSVSFEKGSFYENFDFLYNKLGYYRYEIHKSSVPVHKKFSITITPNINDLDHSNLSHYIITQQSNFGSGQINYLDTVFKDGIYYAYPRELGIFSLTLDTIPPSISCPAFSKSKKVSKRLSFLIKDKESGINTYDVFIDGKWVLAEYEYKNHSLFIPDLDKEGITNGEHDVKVIVTDKANNEQIYVNNFEKL